MTTGFTRRTFLRRAGAAVAAGLTALPAGPLSAAPTPSSMVETFHAALLDVMRAADRLGIRERYQRLAPALDAAFHMRLMTRIVTGPAWRDIGDAKREEVTAAFRHLSISTYASRFDGYSGQSFETLGERDGPRDTVLVATRLIDPGDAPVSLTYVATTVEDRWWLIDVLLDDGVSELAVRRSEYRRVLKDEGVDGLIRALNGKAETLLATG